MTSYLFFRQREGAFLSIWDFCIYREDCKKELKAGIFVLWGCLYPSNQANWYWSRRFGNVSFYPFRQANEASTLPFASSSYPVCSASGRVENLAEILSHDGLKDTRSSKETNSKLRFNPFAFQRSELFLSIFAICIAREADRKADEMRNKFWCCTIRSLLWFTWLTAFFNFRYIYIYICMYSFQASFSFLNLIEENYLNTLPAHKATRTYTNAYRNFPLSHSRVSRWIFQNDWALIANLWYSEFEWCISECTQECDKIITMRKIRKNCYE